MSQSLAMVVLVSLLSAWLAAPALARSASGETDLRVAWQDFLTKDAKREPRKRYPYEHCFRRASTRHGVPLALLLAVARGESDFDPNARSHANAHGLMQILWPGTARELGLKRLSDLYDPCKNVDAGTRYLKHLLKHYNGDLHLALAAYNYGPRRIGINARRIPDGATWYSGYIYRHLNYVLGRTSRPGQSPSKYRDEGKLELLVFQQPYRAQAFVRSLKGAQPKLRLDWFRAGSGRFRVLLLYADEPELRASKRMLAQAGFRLD